MTAPVCATATEDAALDAHLRSLSDLLLIRELLARWAACDATVLMPPEPGVRQLFAVVGEFYRRWDPNPRNTCATCARADCETIGLVHMPCAVWTDTDDGDATEEGGK